MLETSIKYVNRAFEHDPNLGKHETEILHAVGLWYNGAWFDMGLWLYNIGYQKPPSMRFLLGCREAVWQNEYEPALERLQDDGYLEERYILRRKCKWAPTRKGRNLIADLFAEAMQPYTPLKQFPDNDDELKELVGDWNETLLHRTGVETVSTILTHRRWVCSLYPNDDFPMSIRPDIRGICQVGKKANGDPKVRTIAVEVLTDHNDPTVPERKYAGFAEQSHHGPVWIFENRAHAFRTLNRLHRSDDVDCNLVNAPYHKPENYPISVGNEYINRSKSSAEHSCPGINEIGTITGWYEKWLNEETLREMVYKQAPGFEDNHHGPAPYVDTV